MTKRTGRIFSAALMFFPLAAAAPRHAAVQQPMHLAEADSPPFMLTEFQLFDWSPMGALAEPRNISRVRLAGRFVDVANEPNQRADFDPRVRVLLAPDGMNNFGNYLERQPRFNLYTFTHWAHVDLLVWFGGTASHPVSIPARPWVEAAHRNGVKVLGTLFFAPAAWGGSIASLQRVLRKDSAGRFPAADRLIAIAKYYGFDGWLINQETDLTAGGKDAAGGTALAHRMLQFIAYLTRTAPAPMEIHWYDAMLPDGSVNWQNELTPRNLSFLQDGGQRVSDALFLNYGWSRDGLRRSAALARANGRSRYDLFAGVDLWPQREAQPAFRNVRWLDDLREVKGGKSLTSIALFAPNFNFNLAGPGLPNFESNAGNVELFDDLEVRLFAGDALNIAAPAPSRSRWRGIASLVPGRSTIRTLPFETHFNTGHGLHDARAGRLVGGPWHDMSRQDILPTWQFAFSPGSRVRVRYDFDRPYWGGSSLRVAVAGVSGTEIPLFLTKLQVSRATALEAVTATRSRRFVLRLRLHGGRSLDLPIRTGAVWQGQRWCLGQRVRGRIDRISIVARSSPKPDSDLLLGGVSLKDEAICRRGAT